MSSAFGIGAASIDMPSILVQNIFAIGSVTVSSEADDGAFANALTDGTFDYWTPASAIATASVDMGSPVYCDAIGIAAHTLGSSGATIQVQSSDNNSTWIDRISISPDNDTSIMGIFALTLARYWRVRVSDGPASIGALKLGRRIIVPSSVPVGYVSADHSLSVELMSGMTITGQFLPTRVIRRSGLMTVDLGPLPEEFIDDDFAPFEQTYNDGLTFFYAGNPVCLPKDVAYCRRPVGSSEIRPTYIGGDLMSVEFEAEVYAG
jgi:hypothetical protein